MSSKGKSKLLPNGLTPKQEAFKNIVIKQIQAGKNPNGTQAAIEVYDTTDKVTAQNIASENFTKPLIKKSIEDELSAIGLSRGKLMENVGKIATLPVPKASAEVVLKSNLALLELISPRKGAGEVHNTINFVNLGYSEAKEELAKMKGQADEFVTEAE